MVTDTALETVRLTIRADGARLQVADGRITLEKRTPTGDAPSTVSFDVAEVRGTELQAPTRRGRGWLHLAVVGGTPPPPGALAAAADPYTLPLSSRSVAVARRVARLVARHLRTRGLPPDRAEAGTGSGVSLTHASRPTTAPAVAPPPRSAETAARSASEAASRTRTEDAGSALVAELRALADLHDRGALSEEEFEIAKARLLG